ncbi:MAG: hypothetical protein QM495_12730 [Lutibacter sp.]|uniref:hypothetical protein n=1 Tax=Lutibacter sp. TaxID=1925666 RepID=UPI003858682B
MIFKKIIILFYLLLLSLPSFAQNEKDIAVGNIEFGTELQLYPVGYMPTITSNIFIKNNIALRFRIGGNFANRQDFSGLNDEEIVKGFGGSIGLVKYFPYRKGNFIAGFTVDGWNMWTDWKDELNTSTPKSGTTYNLVIQPWINAGYLYKLSEKWSTGLTLGIGREINAITSGKQVGEGWIGSLTLTTNFLIKN